MLATFDQRARREGIVVRKISIPVPAEEPAEQVPPAEFAAVVGDEDVVTVNVHVPDEGSIPGTDAAIPFDQITTSVGDLPQERSMPLAVYCRTGQMSAEAVQTLRDLGYTDVVELRGGMEAWTADGCWPACANGARERQHPDIRQRSSSSR